MPIAGRLLPASLRRPLRRRAVALTERLARRLRLEVVEQPVYSPIPAVPPAEDPIWSARASLHDIVLDLDRQLELLERDLRPYAAEFTRELRERDRFELWNGQYVAGDAEALYALLRHLRPGRVLELGSGFSTLITAAACARNAREGDPAELLAVDPDPRIDLAKAIESGARLERRPCQELGLEPFLELDAGDVLFIDTSHVVKLGGEVNWLLLEVLPRLRAGVNVHIHDVHVPYEYPRYLFEQGLYFNEQYAVHAFLIGNPDWEVTLALCPLFRERKERLLRVLPSLAEDPPGLPGYPYVPSAFWMRRRPGGA